MVLDPPPEHDQDLGDLGVSEGRVLRYLVQDRSGNPIEGAFASTGGDVDRSTKTDATGRGAITIGDDVKAVRIGALKFEIAEVPVPAALPDVVPVVLAPNAGLEVALTGPHAVPRSLRVRMSAESEDALAGGRAAHDALYEAAGASANETGSVDSRGTIIELRPRRGRTRGDRRPEARDSDHPRGHRRSGRRAREHQRDARPWRMEDRRARGHSARRATLSGRVRDEAGKPVAGAQIEIEAESEDAGEHPGRMGGDAGQMFATTDALRPVLRRRDLHRLLFSSSCTRQATPSSFATASRSPTDGAELDLVLQKGCTLTVRYFDGGGVPIRDLMVEADVAGFPTTYATRRSPASTSSPTSRSA